MDALQELLDTPIAPTLSGYIKIYEDVEQGSDEWFEMRRGILTASEMDLIITPTMKIASNDKERKHLYELAAQRISGFVDPSYVSDKMLRGKVDEIEALQLYNKNYGECQRVGFITNSKYGFKIGYSPDALIGKDGTAECKSRDQKYQVETIIKAEMPTEHVIQVQTGMLVSERKWCDYISYSGGLPMYVLRIFPDAVIQKAIIDAATAFEEKITKHIKIYQERLADKSNRLIPTIRKPPEQELIL